MGPPRALRSFAAFTLLVLVASIVFGEPSPGLAGEHLGVTASLAAFVGGLALCRPWGSR